VQGVPNLVHLIHHNHSGGAQVPLSEVAEVVVLSPVLIVGRGQVSMRLDAEATPMAQERLCQPIFVSKRVGQHSCKDIYLLHGRCDALAMVVGWDNMLVLAGQVANEAKEDRCCPSMPKGPTLKRHVTTQDKLEGVDRAMHLYARTIT
jgi:hypothetical protein